MSDSAILLIIIVFIGYILPIYPAYRFMKKAHYHPDGRWHGLRADMELAFIPFANLILSSMSWRA